MLFCLGRRKTIASMNEGIAAIKIQAVMRGRAKRRATGQDLAARAARAQTDPKAGSGLVVVT